MAYRVYITDALRAISKNTASLCGGDYAKIRWVEIINPKKQDTRTSEEIISTIVRKIGGDKSESV